MKRYRIYTENKDYEYITTLLENQFDDFTVFHGTSFWNGIKEASIAIEIISDTDRNKEVRYIAKKIKIHNEQIAVLVTVEDIGSELV